MSDTKYLADECAMNFAKFLKDKYKAELMNGNVKEICREWFYDDYPGNTSNKNLLDGLRDVFPNANPLISMDLAIFVQYFFQKLNFNVKWSWIVDSRKYLFLAQRFITDYSGDLNLDNNIDSLPDIRILIQDIENLKQINFPNDFECMVLVIESCPNLTAISLPGSNKANIAFCQKLKEIKFTTGIRDKENSHITIQGCPSLNKLTLTRDTRIIPRGFIYRCPKLKEIIYEGTKDEWEEIELERHWCNKPIKIICTDGEIKINN